MCVWGGVGVAGTIIQNKEVNGLNRYTLLQLIHAHTLVPYPGYMFINFAQCELSCFLSQHSLAKGDAYVIMLYANNETQDEHTPSCSQIWDYTVQ